jgi:hypothetical protein
MSSRANGRIGICLVGAVLLGGALAWAQGAGGRPTPPPAPLGKSAAKPKTKTNDNEGFELTPTRLDATTHLTMGVAKPTTDHHVVLDGLITTPPDTDAVCVTEKLYVSSAEDAEGASLLVPPASGSSSALPQHVRYGAVVNNQTKVQVPNLALTASPYTIACMTLEGEAVIALERKEATLPGNVMSSPVETGIPGVTARITSMQISNAGVVKISTEYTRAEGKDTPIVDAMHAIDEQGKDLGGGRWNLGAETFGAMGRFEFEFKITPGEKIASVKTILVTKYKIVPLRFTLREIFQK